MYRLLSSINSKVRCLIAVTLTTLLLLILLWPTDVHRNGSFFSNFVSFELRPFDLIEAVGHIILFTFITLIWQWTLVKYVVQKRVFLITFIIVITLAIGTEFGQYFVNRSSILLDLLANMLGIGIAILTFGIIYRQKA